MSNYYKDVKTTTSVADAYRSMYAKPNEDILNEELIDSIIEDVREEEINEWLDYLEEDSMMSYPKKNEKKIRPMLMKIAKKHPKVKVSFGTHSKGKFVDDNNINFKGQEKDIDMLMKDIQNNHKNLVKMMEDNDLDESKGLAAKAKKSGISVGTLRKVYNRGMAAWKTGHRPGTTPQQWGMARVNAFIVKKKKGNLNHDKDLAHVIHPDDSMLDEAMKLAQIVRKHKSALMKAKRTGNLEIPQKAEDELSNWASNNGEIRGDDPDEFSDWLDNHLDELVPTLKIKEEVELSESFSKPMPLKTYANRIAFDAKEKQWIMDNEKDVPMFFPNDKLKTSLVLGYPVRTNDYYFAFLTGEDDKRVKMAREANLKMNILLQQEYKKALARGGIDFKKEPEKLYALSGYLWNVMTKAFDKLPSQLGAGDTMTRDELYVAIEDLVGEPPIFESYDYQGETIQEGRLSGIFGKIANKIRSAKKKIKKRFKLGRKAKDFSDIKENQSPKLDANVLKSVADTYASMQNYGIQGDIVESLQELESLLEAPYDKADVKKVQGLEKKLRNMLKEVDKVMRGSGLSAPAFSNVRSGITKGLQSIEKFYKIANTAPQKRMLKNSINEVKRQEVDAMKKVSKDMQKVLVSYQKIANMGDKELKNTVHNKDYKKVLDARDTILKMIGTLNTKMILQKEDFELVEASAGEMIDKLFKTGGDKMFQYGVAKLLNMTGVKVAMSMQKQNPVGFKNTMVAMGKDNKIKLATNNALMKMFKQQGVKPLPEELDNDDKPVVKKIVTMLKKASKKHAKQADDLEKAVSEGKGKNFAQQAAIAIAKKKSGKYDKDGKKIDERVKDGKLDPLSKMGKSKLTGQEINKYYRDNPKQKAAARDKTVKKAIELALDLSGATNYAIKEIEKLKRGLSKNPAVKLALRHANESKEFTGHHVVIENLSPANVVKLKTFGKMMAKMTKLPFDEKDPEKSIDKLMGQVWKQKHVPANWERLHKMVAMLRDIGVKMPSLKGKYMGLDPVTKKAIFYKEGTDEMVEWHQKIEDIKEGIEELVEKQEMKDADIKKIAQMTDRNDHTGSLMHFAKLLGDRQALGALKGIMMTHKALGHMPEGLMRTRNQIYDNLVRQSSRKYSNHKDIMKSL